MIVAAPAAAAPMPPSSPKLGVAEGRCRPGERGPAFLVDVAALRDRAGLLRLELYHADDRDFLADDNVLVAAGKPFARVDAAPPATGPVTLCIRAPGSGAFALSLLHDRDGNRRFGYWSDGVGFSNNPRLGVSKPSAASVRIVAAPGVTRLRIVPSYRLGLLSFGPIGK